MKHILLHFQNLRFKQKLFISYMIVCIIPLVVLGTFSYYQASQFLFQQAKQNLEGTISQLSETMNYRTKQYEAIINSITQNIVFKQIFLNNYDDFPVLYRDYVDPFFGNILDFNKDILQISIFTDNDEILRGNYILPIELTRDLQWATRTSRPEITQWNVLNGKLFVTRMFIDDSSPRTAALPAILFLSIDADSMFQDLGKIKTDAYGVFILDEYNHTIWSNHINLSEPPSESEILVNDLSGGSGTFRSNAIDYMFMTQDIPEPKWRLVWFAPKRSISNDATSIVSTTVIITIICLIFLVILIWMFSNTFVKRIIKLNKKMLIVERGNLNIDVSSDTKDEIGQLTNQFGRMLTNINTLIKEVYESKIIQKEAELKALQTQINPHFLYNTLSIINWKALQIDAMEISQITNTVSKFYRTVLNKGKNYISVADELENARAYMHIQLIMHNHSFDFECEVEEDLLSYDMINLVFQPILENALEHGIDQLRKGSARGKIMLAGYHDGDDLQFSITDNGPGMSQELSVHILNTHSAGYGLRNVHDRIQIRFGSDYGISIHSELGKGTMISIRFPKYISLEEA